jgi:conserved repeat domain
LTDLESRSRVVLPALTVVNVDDVLVLDGPGGSPVGVVSPGDTVTLRAVVSDPFGFADISAVEFTVTNADGIDVSPASPVVTVPVSDNGTEQAIFELAWTVPFGSEGDWTVTAVAREGVEGEVEHSGIETFELGLPDFLILKSSPQVFSDPVNGTSNPKRIPGAVVLYQIQVSNQGRGRADADSVAVTDNLPGGLELGVPPGGDLDDAITFSDGATPSNLTLVPASDVVYTLSSGTAPTDGDNDGCYENVDGFVVTPSGRMNGEAPPAPSFTLSYRACVR